MIGGPAAHAASPTRTAMRPSLIAPVAPVAILLTLAFVSFTAAAADPPARKEGSLGGGKGSGAYLTRDELRSCLSRQTQTRTQDAELAKEQATLGPEKEQIVRDGDALKARLDTLDRSNAEALGAYNDAVLARDKQIDAFQLRVDAFNRRVEANQPVRAAFVKECGSRRYLEDDEAAIRNGK